MLLVAVMPFSDRLAQLGEPQRDHLKNVSLELLAGGSHALSDAPLIRNKLAVLVSAIATRDWPQRWSGLMSELFAVSASSLQLGVRRRPCAEPLSPAAVRRLRGRASRPSSWFSLCFATSAMRSWTLTRVCPSSEGEKSSRVREIAAARAARSHAVADVAAIAQRCSPA